MQHYHRCCCTVLIIRHCLHSLLSHRIRNSGRLLIGTGADTLCDNNNQPKDTPKDWFYSVMKPLTSSAYFSLIASFPFLLFASSALFLPHCLWLCFHQLDFLCFGISQPLKLLLELNAVSIFNTFLMLFPYLFIQFLLFSFNYSLILTRSTFASSSSSHPSRFISHIRNNNNRFTAPNVKWHRLK